MVHVQDVDGAVGSALDVDRPEQRIGADDELAARICVPDLGQPVGLDDPGAADEPADRIREEQIAVQIRGVAIASHDLGAGRRREVIEVIGRQPDARQASLHVADAGRRVRNVEAFLPLIRNHERPVLNRNLEIGGAALAGRIHQPDLAVVIHRHAPLGTGRARGFADDASRRPAEAEGVVGAVDPVVQRPDEPALRLLHVAAPARAHARVEHLAPVRDAVAVGIRQPQHIVGVRLVGEDVLVERQIMRETTVVGEDGVPVNLPSPFVLSCMLIRLVGSCWRAASTSSM